MKMESLPLTAIEELFVWADQPGRSSQVHFRMGFTGLLQRKPLEEALKAMVARHPLLRSRVEIDKGGRACWIVLPEGDCPVEWHEGPLGVEPCPLIPMDLTERPGFRVRAVVDAATGRSWLFLILHHACADGGGIQQMTVDLLAVYAAASDPSLPRPTLKPLRPDRLSERGYFGLNGKQKWKMLPGMLVGLLGVRQYLMRDPVDLLPNPGVDEDAPASCESTATETVIFDERETERLVKSPRRLKMGATINDLLTRDLFLALAEWRKETEAAQAKDWLRLMVPVNMRVAGLDDLPASNVVSTVFLDRQAEQMSHEEALLLGIRNETSRIKRYKLGFIFVLSVLCARSLPGGLARFVRRHERLGSMIFSNVGRIYESCDFPRCVGRIVAGNVTLDEAFYVPPLFLGIHAGIVCSTYAGRLMAGLRYDRRYMTPEQGAGLLSRWVERLRKSMAEA